MAYQVEYEMESIRIIKKSVKKDVMAVIVLTMVFVFAALGAYFGGSVCQILLTEKGRITRSAAEQLVEELQSGVPLQDAVQVFCSEIIQ